MAILDAVSRERFEEAAVFSFPARSRPLTQRTIAEACYESITYSSKSRNNDVKGQLLPEIERIEQAFALTWRGRVGLMKSSQGNS
jgi:hypothetical protein